MYKGWIKRLQRLYENVTKVNDDLGDREWEPRVLRSKVKELRESLDWVLSDLDGTIGTLGRLEEED